MDVILDWYGMVEAAPRVSESGLGVVSALMGTWQKVIAHLERVVMGTPLCKLYTCLSRMVPVSCGENSTPLPGVKSIRISRPRLSSTLLIF